MSPSLKESVQHQRMVLKGLLKAPLQAVAEDVAEVWGEPARLNQCLEAAFQSIPHCTFLYAVDVKAVQVSATVTVDQVLSEDLGRDRSSRPYMREAVPAEGFLLSEAYISLRKRRPSLTAIQIVRSHEGGAVLGFLGADFDLRDLPITQSLYEEPVNWRQVKGDPAIRGSLFSQTRSESLMDQHMDDVVGVLEELMVDHGVYHTINHFSSSRSTIWLLDDPYRYRLLGVDEITDPDICLAYPKRSYPKRAEVREDQVRPVLETFKRLRFMDETIYLRSGSLNLFNGIVGLTFSCDGSHYMKVDEFLDKDLGFWVGSAG